MKAAPAPHPHNQEKHLVSPIKPTTTDSDPSKKQRVFPADFHEFVTTTATGLGDGWAVDADSQPHPGPSAYITHPDGRRIGIKRIWRGEAVQTWALDVPPREFDNDGDAEPYTDSLKHLTPGIRYNVGVCFTNNPPAATAARNIRTRLLPAFDGKRPPLRAFPKKPSRRAAEVEKPPAAADATTSSESSQAADQHKPEKATAKAAVPARSPRRTAKKAQPTAKKTEPKKQPAAPRSKRPTAKASKTASSDETTAKKKSQSAETTTGN